MFTEWVAAYTCGCPLILILSSEQGRLHAGREDEASSLDTVGQSVTNNCLENNAQGHSNFEWCDDQDSLRGTSMPTPGSCPSVLLSFSVVAQ